MSPDLVALLADLEKTLAKLPPREAPAAIGELERLKATLWARMTSATASNGQPEEDRLLSPAEAAARLGVQRSRLYNLTRTGALPAVRVGKYVRVRASALAQWVTEQEKVLSSGVSSRYTLAHEGQRAPAPPQAARADAGRVRPAPRGPQEHSGPGRARRAADSPIGRKARPAARRPRPAPAPDDNTDETQW